MKFLIHSLLLAGTLVLSANPAAARSVGWSFGAAQQQRTVLVIQADGRCLWTNDATFSRASAEQMVHMWESFRRVAEGEDEEGTNEKRLETKPFTDVELAAKIRQAVKTQAEESSAESAATIDLLEIHTNTVHVITSRAFSSLQETLKEAHQVWGQSGLSFENVRFEKDTNGHLRVTLSPHASAARYARNLRQQWKLTGARMEFRMVFPGRVLSSGLPDSQEKSTWLMVDPHKDETIQSALKLYEAPTIITAELAGLKLDQPLESKTLQRLARRDRGEAEDLPITEAGPGFVAEPIEVITTTLLYFPEGEKYLKRRNPFGMQSTGTVVRAKLFVPKGRTVRSVSEVRVLKATDDKGRPIASPAETSDDSPGTEYSSGGSRDTSSTQIQLQLGLPQPDAQTIEELSAEAVALTVGKWKELTITNAQASAQREIDLGPVLPGAKLMITKATSRQRQITVQARLTGPPAIRRLDVQGRMPGNERVHAYTTERNFSTKDGQSTRTLDVQSYTYGSDAGRQGEAESFSLLVRYPEDLRRERVKFKLSGLDLF